MPWKVIVGFRGKARLFRRKILVLCVCVGIYAIYGAIYLALEKNWSAKHGQLLVDIHLSLECFMEKDKIEELVDQGITEDYQTWTMSIVDEFTELQVLSPRFFLSSRNWILHIELQDDFLVSSKIRISGNRTSRPDGTPIDLICDRSF